MKRGTFIKNLGLLFGAVTIAPTIVVKAIGNIKEKVVGIAAHFRIDHSKKIIYVGGNNKTISVLEFHKWLQTQTDEVERGDDDIRYYPSTKSTDNIITLREPYHIDTVTAEKLTDGSIIQKGGKELYTSI